MAMTSPASALTLNDLPQDDLCVSLGTLELADALHFCSTCILHRELLHRLSSVRRPGKLTALGLAQVLRLRELHTLDLSSQCLSIANALQALDLPKLAFLR